MFRLINQCPYGMMYVVQPGDTIRSLASRFRVFDDSILYVNPFIQDPNMLYPGQILCIPAKNCHPHAFVYVVKPGDTLYNLANLFNLSVQEILSVNPSLNPNILPAGQPICIPEPLY